MKYFKMTAALATLACTAALAISEDKIAPKETELTAQRLVGAYQLISGEKNGEKIPDERIRGGLVRITADTIVGADQNRKELYAAKYKLDASKKPAVITMTSTMDKTKDVTVQGLIQLEGNTLKLIYALPDEGKMPTEFKTRTGQLMVVLERTKD
jgi:uncharacterized protein (TIGR03067 family)